MNARTENIAVAMWENVCSRVRLLATAVLVRVVATTAADSLALVLSACDGPNTDWDVGASPGTGTTISGTVDYLPIL